MVRPRSSLSLVLLRVAGPMVYLKRGARPGSVAYGKVRLLANSRSQGNPKPFPLFLTFLIKGGLIGLLLRASNEGLLRPRVARARETNRLPSLTNRLPPDR